MFDAFFAGKRKRLSSTTSSWSRSTTDVHRDEPHSGEDVACAHGKIAEEFRLPLSIADANKDKLKKALKDYGLI